MKSQQSKHTQAKNVEQNENKMLRNDTLNEKGIGDEGIKEVENEDTSKEENIDGITTDDLDTLNVKNLQNIVEDKSLLQEHQSTSECKRRRLSIECPSFNLGISPLDIIKQTMEEGRHH